MIPTMEHARARATVVHVATGVEAIVVYVSGPRGRSAKIVKGGRHYMVPKDELRVVTP